MTLAASLTLMGIVGVGLAAASWTTPASGTGRAAAARDFRAPTIPQSVIAPVGITATGGYVGQGDLFVVYANLSDTGNPPSGVASVTAHLAALAASATAVALSPCTSSCTVSGVTYGYTSVPVRADSPLPAGPTTYTVVGSDVAGNTSGPVTFPVVVDNAGPTVSASVIANTTTNTAGWIKQGGTYRIYANATDTGAGVSSLTADASAVTAGQTAVTLPACTSSCTISGITYAYKSAALTAANPLAETTLAYSITATDKAPNVGTTPGFSVAVDNTAPVVTASVIANTTTNTAGWIKQGGTYRIYANATDTGAGVSSLTADASAVTAGQTAVTLPACTSSCTISGITYAYKSAALTAANPLAETTLAYSITATDKAPNVGTTPGFSVAVDNTAPVVTASVIANTTTNTAGWIKKSGVYAVYANAQDSASGLSGLTADVSAVTAGQTTLALTPCGSSCTIGGVTYAWKSATKTAGTGLAEGALTYTVTPTDQAANSAASPGFGVQVDNTAPSSLAAVIANTTTGIGGYLRQGGTYNVYANATDNASGTGTITANVSTVTTGLTTLALASCTSGCTVGGVTYQYKSATTTANAVLSAGSKTFSLAVQDLAANSSTLSGVTVTVDNTAPTVAITFPLASYAGGWEAGCSTPSTGDVCGTATDASSGINQIQLSIRQATSPNNYWNPAPPGFTSSIEILLTTIYTPPNWALAFPAANLATATAYTVRALATDNAGNTASTSTTFTFTP